MKRTDFSDMHCSIAQTLNVVGEWWSLLIIRDVFLGNRKFSGMLNSLGISKKVLADRLNTLLAEGILEQKPYGSDDGRFEYHLTEKGNALGPILLSMLVWGDKFVFKNKAPIVLTHKECGKKTRPVLVCDQCGEPIYMADITGKPGKGMSDNAKALWLSLQTLKN